MGGGKILSEPISNFDFFALLSLVFDFYYDRVLQALGHKKTVVSLYKETGSKEKNLIFKFLPPPFFTSKIPGTPHK